MTDIYDDAACAKRRDTYKRCENCRYWYDLRGGEGDCRRMAPGLTEKDGMAVWPLTTAGDWCGECLLKEQILMVTRRCPHFSSSVDTSRFRNPSYSCWKPGDEKINHMVSCRGDQFHCTHPNGPLEPSVSRETPPIARQKAPE